MRFAGFEERRHGVEGADLHVRSGGTGDPVVLLHGYPETGAMWHEAAVALAASRTVVVPDLRGYGASLALDGRMTFRSMAGDVVALMGDLGFDRFDVVGHDRGARTAHRLVLDHPEAVASLALLDILPTLEVWRHMDGWLARRYFHWPFLAQGGGLPERLVGSDPLAWLHHALGSLGGAGHLHPEAVEEYERAALRPGVVAAWCADYAAGAGIDCEHDEADEGRTLPHRTLVLWGTTGVVGAQVDPLATWRRWFPAATGESVPAGHFLVEERPDLVVPLLVGHLGVAGV